MARHMTAVCGEGRDSADLDARSAYDRCCVKALPEVSTASLSGAIR